MVIRRNANFFRILGMKAGDERGKQEEEIKMEEGCAEEGEENVRTERVGLEDFYLAKESVPVVF